jgi:hypothetical protein
MYKRVVICDHCEFGAFKGVLRYVVGTLHMGIVYGKGGSKVVGL